jgi:hypothetical protein
MQMKSFLRSLSVVFALLLAPLTVLAGSGTGGGNALPSSFPQVFGIGVENFRNADTGWMAATGLPWNYNYTYVQWGCPTGNYLDTTYCDQSNGFTQNIQYWLNNTIPSGTVPVLSMYLGGPCNFGPFNSGWTWGGGTTGSPAEPNGSWCVFNTVKAAAQLTAAWSSTRPVIIQFDPDTSNWMLQYSGLSCSSSSATTLGAVTGGGAAASLQVGDSGYTDSNIPVAINTTNFPDSLAGFWQLMRAIVHYNNPNAYLAYDDIGCGYDYMWPTFGSTGGSNFASFFNALHTTGVAYPGPDFLIEEMSDRECECAVNAGTCGGPTPNSPAVSNYCNAIGWQNLLAYLQSFYSATGVRSLLWQTAEANSASRMEQNVFGEFQGAHPDYFFTPSNRTPAHPYGVNIYNFTQAGLIGIMFGAGQSNSTNAETMFQPYGGTCNYYVTGASYASNQITFTTEFVNYNLGAATGPWNLNTGDKIYVYGSTSSPNYNGWWTLASAPTTTSSTPYVTTFVVTAASNPGTYTAPTNKPSITVAPAPINGNMEMPHVEYLTSNSGAIECDGGHLHNLAATYYSLGAMPIQ